jgi:hypothetical protein
VQPDAGVIAQLLASLTASGQVSCILVYGSSYANYVTVQQ